MRILCVSTPIGYLGSGEGGGVELTLLNLAQALQAKGHEITVIAPEKSQAANLRLLTVAGQAQPIAQNLPRTAAIQLPADSVLAAMWELARSRQAEFDIIVNFAYDWLPLYLSPFFQAPVAHLISMGSLTDAMDQMVRQVAQRFPESIAFHTQTQAATFNLRSQHRYLLGVIDVGRYAFQAQPDSHLGWVGRIAREKGLEDAVEAAEQTQTTLKIWGFLQDKAYWQEIQRRYPDAPLKYEGFLANEDLQQALGSCRALLMTPRWVEALGNVAIEALACGVPVIAYARGGPSELICHGQTGYLVEPDQVDGLISAIQQIGQIDRAYCRQQAKSLYSLEAAGDRTEQWLLEVLKIQAN